MKNLSVLAVLVALGGCVVAPHGSQYGARYSQPSDPSQWRVVSVTPVPMGTGDKVAAQSPDGSRVEYSSRPVAAIPPAYLPPPQYVERPVYYPEPSYYLPPVALSLGFIFGHHWSRGHGHRHGHGGHFRGRRR